MTTELAARQYLAEHMSEWGDQGYAVYNPHGRPEDQLPWIIGFNNGGEPGWYSACLIAEDGTGMGGHMCSHEGYMRHDLGILNGARSDRHEYFRKHYPDGYRMDFAPWDDPRIQAAYVLNQKLSAEAGQEEYEK